MTSEFERDLDQIRTFVQEAEPTQEAYQLLDKYVDWLINEPSTFSQKQARLVIKGQIERHRLVSVQSASSPELEAIADEHIETLRRLYRGLTNLFTEEDKRWLKTFPQLIQERKETIALTKRLKQKAPRPRRPWKHRQDQCWRCHTPVDSAWHEICPLCMPDNPEMTGWMICPTCRACGCHRHGVSVQNQRL
jgi:hypothetical protein